MSELEEGEDKVLFRYKFDQEIEDRIKYYMSLTRDIPIFPENKKKYRRVSIPLFATEFERKEWEREEIRRCKEGHDGMCGKMYLWFHYGYIKNIKGGRIAPQFRVCDNEWFSFIESFKKQNSGFGGVCVKRRRGGFSWKEALDIVHDAQFTPFATIGVNSKSERDTIILFNKVKFIYDNLPPFLRSSTEAGKSKMSMFFAFKKKDKFGNTVIRGTQSEIVCVPPTDSAYEGMMLSKWVCDEAGKIPNLLQMWSYTEDCLMQETKREGIPIIFGTSGEVGKNGAGLMELWYKAELYGLKKFFFAGWMGLAVDEYGNDKKEECIRHILHQRKIKESMSAKMYNEYLQKYPLTPEEAFMQLSEGGAGDPVKINAQIVSLQENPPRKITGYFKHDGIRVVFVPSPTGKCIIYEHPETDMKNLAVAGCLTPGEKVMTARGLINVEDVTKDDLLINENGDQVPIIQLLRYNVKNEDTYRLKVANTYRTTNFTKEHPILVSKPSYKYNYKRNHEKYKFNEGYWDFDFNYTTADKVNVGDWIKVPNIYRRENNFDIKSLWDDTGINDGHKIENPLYNPDFWWFIGLWLGDGWCESDGYKISVSFNKEEKYYIDKFIEVSKRLFNREAYIRSRGSVVECSICCKQMNEFLNSHFGKYADGKKIPEWARYINEECKKRLVLGYLSSDGSIMLTKRGDYSMEFVSINLELLEAMQDIMFALGYTSGLSKLRDESIHHFRGKESKTKSCYHLRFSHHDTVDFAKSIYDIKDIKLSRIDLNNIKHKRKKPKNWCFLDESLDYIYIQIKDIEHGKYDGIVYNFECETHTFMCHHITTHNCDPADHDNTVEGASNMSLFIIKKQNGISQPKVIFEYTDRPKKSVEFYDQAIYALEYYNCKVLIEKNRYRMISHFDENGFKHLLTPAPSSYLRRNARPNEAMGVHVNEDTIIYIKGLIEWYVDHYCDTIPSIELLQEFLVFGTRNTDRAMAFGMALMLLKEDRSIAKKKGDVKSNMPRFGFKSVNGNIQRTTKS